MGAPVSQIQAPQTSQPQGKGGVGQHVPQNNQQNTFQDPTSGSPNFGPVPGQSDGISRPMGKGGRITYPGQDGQPRVGQPNNYSNTVGPWDNATIGTQNPAGKGKGA